LSRLVDRKSPDYHYRYWVGHIASDSARRFRVSYGADGKRVIPHNPLFYASHVCAGGTTVFVLEGASSKPVIERQLPAVELRKIVFGGELFWWIDPLLTDTHLSHGALVLNRRANRGLLAGGLSSMAVKRLNWSSGKIK
jgi:hypothetical protein